MLNFVGGLALTIIGCIAIARGMKILGKLTNRVFDFFDGFLE